MNSPQQNNNDQPPAVDRTYVEGSDGAAQFHALDSGVRIDTNALQTGKKPAVVFERTTLSLQALNEGAVLGSGKIVGVLGAGGMAKIYKIWNEKLEVFRAIKIMLPSHEQELVRRFETEAKITAKLHHPNIVEIYSVGDFNGLPYLEMEYIEGEALDSIINRSGVLPPAVCTAVCIFIARALSYAHSQEFLLYGNTYRGVIHRDLKPANIMISSKGDVKLMDFGIARPTETSLHTVDGNIVGTMQYLSPEQLDAGDIDCRTDIYSFGAILYEMLTGAKTFPQKTITNLMKMKSLNQYRRLTEFPFPVPPSLAKIAQKCLERSKEDRYQNAGELLRALERAHGSFTQDTPEQVMRQFIASPHQFTVFRRSGLKKALVPALVGAGAFAVIGLTIAILLATRPEPAPTASETQSSVADFSGPAAGLHDAIPQTPRQPLPSAPDNAAAERIKSVQKAPPVERAPRISPAPALQKAAAPVPKTPPAPSRLDQLKTDYHTDDLLSIARRCLESNNAADAIVALQALPPNFPDQELKNLYLLEAYIAAGRQGEARSLAAAISSGDAQFDFLRGRMEEKSSNEDKALGYYQSALTKPSNVRDIQTIRKDALYHTALIYDNRYRRSPTTETRLQALNGWNVVKRSYGNTPEHPRFKTANEKLAAIQ